MESFFKLIDDVADMTYDPFDKFVDNAVDSFDKFMDKIFS